MSWQGILKIGDWERTYNTTIRQPETRQYIARSQDEYTKEEYYLASKENKIKYHIRQRARAQKENNRKLAAFHKKMESRLTKNSRMGGGRKERGQLLRDYYSIEESTDEKPFFGAETTKEEYENMNKDEKRDYHSKEAARAKKIGNTELSKFHWRMRDRLRVDRVRRGRKIGNSNLPTSFLPEDN